MNSVQYTIIVQLVVEHFRAVSQECFAPIMSNVPMTIKAMLIV
jgi:hypothetical protein